MAGQLALDAATHRLVPRPTRVTVVDVVHVEAVGNPIPALGSGLGEPGQPLIGLRVYGRW